MADLPWHLALDDIEKRSEALKRKKTNADRIRAMTDKELADFMCRNISNGTVNCAFCAVAEFCRMGHNGWLDWLKQEATDDN